MIQFESDTDGLVREVPNCLFCSNPGRRDASFFESGKICDGPGPNRTGSRWRENLSISSWWTDLLAAAHRCRVVFSVEFHHRQRGTGSAILEILSKRFRESRDNLWIARFYNVMKHQRCWHRFEHYKILQICYTLACLAL